MVTPYGSIFVGLDAEVQNRGWEPSQTEKLNRKGSPSSELHVHDGRRRIAKSHLSWHFESFVVDVLPAVTEEGANAPKLMQY